MSGAGVPTGIAVIGCGLIGRRRAASAAAHEGSRLRVVVDADPPRAEGVAREHGCDVAASWQAVLERGDVQAVVVATPNDLLVEIACAALATGRSVLVEKPPGRNLEETRRLAEAARRTPASVLKIGFNHRYHPSLARLHALTATGEVGRLVNLRARYGHGSRPGCEKEWRADAERAGGGELLDQGVHVADLFHWLAGPPESAFGIVQTAVWQRPVEDNAYGLFRFPGGVVGQLHVSMTQWRNLFSLEVHGEHGALLAEGLGGSYGRERLTRVQRRLEGGVPEVTTEEWGDDPSWTLEWDDFVRALAGAPLQHGSVEDGLVAMRMIDAVYRAAQTGALVAI